MACCVFTAFFMSKIISACELFDVRLLDIKYNDSDAEANFPPGFYAHPFPADRGTAYGKGDLTDINRHTLIAEPIKTVRLLVTGMTCAACVATLTTTLTSHQGVIRTTISLPLSRATIIYDSGKTSTEDLVASVEDVGYGAEVLGKGSQGTAAQNLRILQREDELRELRQAFNGAAKWATTITIVDWVRQGLTSSASLSRTLDTVLHFATLVIACLVQYRHAKWIHRNAWAHCFTRTSWRLPNLSMDTLLSLSLLLSVGLSFFNIALHGLLDPTTKTYFSSASFLTVVVSGGRYLDVVLKKQGTAGFARLFGMQRDLELGSVMVEGRLGEVQPDDQSETEENTIYLTPVPPTLLAPLDTYHIPPQSLIPCDSYVVRGSSLVEESSMTGESVPIRKNVGDFLMSGTRNLSNTVVAVALKSQSDSSLEKLVESVERATEMKFEASESASTNNTTSKSLLIDLMTGYFVPAVLVLSSIGFLASFYHSPEDSRISDRVNVACERAMAILAAACPCAIGLANPSAIMAGIDASYVYGILLPGGAPALENLSGLTHLVLDKTGTLTEGKLQIAQESLIEPFDTDLRRKELVYSLLCAAERAEAQTHPVARAVFQYCLRQLQKPASLAANESQLSHELGTAPTRNVVSVLGKGVKCEVQAFNKLWYTVHVGSEDFLLENDIKVPQRLFDGSDATISDIQLSSDATTVHFSLGNLYVGTFTLRDTVRKSAPSVIRDLRSTGIELTMLTGDTEHEAHRVSVELGIPVLAAKSLPDEKRRLVEELKLKKSVPLPQKGLPTKQSYQSGERNVVAMLGDGLNDAPAQSASDVGILFGLSPLTRSSRAIHTSATDVILLTPDLSVLPKLLDIAKQSTQQAFWNTKWAIAYNVIAIATAMGLAESLLDKVGLDGSVARIDA